MEGRAHWLRPAWTELPKCQETLLQINPGRFLSIIYLRKSLLGLISLNHWLTHVLKTAARFQSQKWTSLRSGVPSFSPQGADWPHPGTCTWVSKISVLMTKKSKIPCGLKEKGVFSRPLGRSWANRQGHPFIHLKKLKNEIKTKYTSCNLKH